MSLTFYNRRREMEARKNGKEPVKAETVESEAVQKPVEEPVKEVEQKEPVKTEVTEEVTETVQEEEPVKKTDAEKLKGK